MIIWYTRTISKLIIFSVLLRLFLLSDFASFHHQYTCPLYWYLSFARTLDFTCPQFLMYATQGKWLETFSIKNALKAKETNKKRKHWPRIHLLMLALLYFYLHALSFTSRPSISEIQLVSHAPSFPSLYRLPYQLCDCARRTKIL